MIRVVMARADLLAALRGLEQSPGAVAVAPVSSSHFQQRRNILVGPLSVRQSAMPHDAQVVLQRGGSIGHQRVNELASPVGDVAHDTGGDIRVELSYQSEIDGLLLDGRMIDRNGAVGAIDELAIVGPGMACVEPFTMRSTTPMLNLGERFSRVAGALTIPVWSRLASLRVGIVGCGRAGAMLAHLLEDLGVSHFILIDPDEVQSHNLGPLYGRSIRHCGQRKVNVLAEALQNARTTSSEPTSVLSKQFTVRPIPTSVTSYTALGGLLDCDVIITTTDHDGARAYVSLVAQAYLKVLLDLGTGVHGHGLHRDMGATVRMTIPGESCLFCLGGFATWEHIQSSLGLAAVEERSRDGRTWHQERAGSLPNLNLTALGHCVTWLQDFLAEFLTSARLLDVSVDPLSQTTLRTLDPGDPNRCPFCLMRGRGDEGWRRGLTLLQEVATERLRD